ncbi:MAG: AAA family ATPase [Bacteroidales bacterium]|nr:AAA family ATPase [Bacteroidales bacterium]
MADINTEALYEAYYSKINQTSTEFVRYLYREINWDANIIGILGARGVGKTTLLLQRIKLLFADNYEQALYVSLDNLWFNTNSLIDLVRHLNMRGVRNLFLDEVHKYKNWTQTLKNISDIYPRMKIVYTGSSMLEIDHSKADMSRRQTLYTMAGMSFREYLEFEGIAQLPSLSLDQLLSRHINLALDITAKVDVMAYFDDYLRHGYYPFYKEEKRDYLIRLRETAKTVIDNDVPAIENFEFETLNKIKKMLMIIAAQVPFVPNINNLSEEIATNRNQTLKILYILDKAKLLFLITEKEKSYHSLVKPEKVLLGNPNLMYALASMPEIGTIRETFFVSQLAEIGSITSPSKGDYVIDGKYLFEVGGARKNFNQIKDIPNSYLAIDDTLVGRGNKIPLWLFGFLK